MTKDALLRLLLERTDSYVSGEELAGLLGVSRTAVWKWIGQLREEGYVIESATNRGYRLSSGSDVLSEEGIRRHLKNRDLTIRCYSSVSSTNTLLKTMAAEGAPAGLVLVAGEQTAGRGRMGRSFFSPSGSGIYMSVLLRPKLAAAEASCITAGAAVAAAEAIESVSGRKTEIKWVNDVLIQGKKVCGILTEGSVDLESGLLNYAVVGIGINAALPSGNFPRELRGLAGAVFPGERPPELRCRLAAAVLDALLARTARPGDMDCWQNYVRRSAVLGRSVNLLSPGREPVPATVLSIEKDYSLTVRLEDGTLRRVGAGEVSLRSARDEQRDSASAACFPACYQGGGEPEAQD